MRHSWIEPQLAKTASTESWIFRQANRPVGTEIAQILQALRQNCLLSKKTSAILCNKILVHRTKEISNLYPNKTLRSLTKYNCPKTTKSLIAQNQPVPSGSPRDLGRIWAISTNLSSLCLFSKELVRKKVKELVCQKGPGFLTTASGSRQWNYWD